MASLWQFFGLPDPEAGQNGRRNETQQPAMMPSATQQQIAPKPIEKPQLAEPIPEPVGVQPPRREIPLGWQGPVTSDGEPFHDLGALHKATPVTPNRALRYIAPDVMNRIPTRGITKRVNQGDTVIVDLRPLVHMDTHQNVCRRELKQMSDDIGVGVFALDAEDKLLLIPGNDVVVDVQSHELGLGALINR